MAILATGSLSTSCMDGLSDQYDLSEGVVKLIPFTVTASTPQDTKATVDYVQQQIFEEDDQLYIESVDGKLTGMLKIKSGGAALAKFEGTLTYTGSGDEPDPNLVLNARLISKNDKIGDKTFVGGIASKMTDAVSQFSTLTGTSTYEKKRFSLNQGTAFVDFSVTFDPAPDDDFYDAELTISGGEISLGTAEVTVLGGNARFALAFPDGTTLDRAKVTLCGKEFKFGGTGKTLTAAKIYKVDKTYSDDLNTPLTLEAVADGTITVNVPETLSPFSGIYYSINGATPVPTRASDDEDPVIYKTTNIPVSAGDIVSFFGDNDRYSLDSSKPEADDLISVTITCSDPCYIYGNVMSLIRSSGFASLTSLSTEGALAGIFSGYMPDNYQTREGGGGPSFTPNHLRNHPSRKLVLPATTLSTMCYASMFAGCTDLETAPELPANIVPDTGYYAMFSDCSSLTDVPAIPATVFGVESCLDMFTECTSLVTAPAFTDNPNAQLGKHCFDYMYHNCSSLKNAPALPFNTLKKACYYGMFTECTSLEVAPDLPAENLAESCYKQMFQGCTSLTQAPALPATHFEGISSVYESMFEGCTSLRTAPALPAMSLNNAHSCYERMFTDCTSLQTAPELPATDITDAYYCYCAMFNGCVNLTAAPVLPATTLATYCYAGMFSNCTSLNYIKCLATDISAFNCTASWVSNVAPTGTFVEAEGMTDWELNSVNGIPPGWRDSKTVPLTLEATADGTITIRIPEAIHGDFNGIYYSINGGESIKTKGDDPVVYITTEINVAAGDKVCLYGDNDTYCMEDSHGTHHHVNIQCNVDCYIYGNVMSLIRREGFASLAGFTEPFTFYGLFEENDHIVNHSSKKLLMPATVLSESCYANMFEYCTGLTVAPELPATQLATRCYNEMFMDTGLTTAPELPSTIMAERCYDHMFAHCVSLTATPSLPATQLALGCYAAMFEDTNLQEAPALPVTQLKDRCYSKMFKETPLSSAPALPATTLAEGCYNMMFESCPNLTFAPELPATTLVSECYYRMFYGCNNLEYIKCLATDISASDCTYNWVKNVAASGTFYRNPDMMDWEINSNKGIPNGWTVYPPMGDPDTATPLTFKAIADGTITIDLADGLSMSYSVNGGSLSTFSGSRSIPVSPDDSVQLFGDNASYCVLDGEGDIDSETNIYCSGDCYIYGNFMSLIDSDGFATATTLTAPYAFADLFEQDKDNNDHILNHPTRNIVLPATTLTPYCYCVLFSNCPNISRAPALPAITLAQGCYEGMFGGCALTEAPALPARNLAIGCYLGMFSNCHYITQGPLLSATTLADECYANMFYGCDNLTIAPALPAETLAEGCYSEMFCKCISLTTAPVLPAPVLVDDCYKYMFGDCSNLSSVTCLATDLSGGKGTKYWLSGVASSGTFVKKTGIDWPSGNSGIPTGWNVTEQLF